MLLVIIFYHHVVLKHPTILVASLASFFLMNSPVVLHIWLVVWNVNFIFQFYFPFHIWDVIFPIDELHHFSEGYVNHQPDESIQYGPIFH
jgi:hypothetical protein